MKQRYTGIYPHGDSIEIQFMYQGRRRETLKLQATVANQAHADRVRRSITDRIALNQFTLDDYREQFPESRWLRKRHSSRASIVTVVQAMYAWYERIRPDVKPSTAKALRSSIRVWAAQLGEMRLTDLTAMTLERAIARMKESRKTVKTIRNNLIPLRSALHDAVNDNLISDNPVLKLRRIKIPLWEAEMRSQQNGADPFDLSDLSEILRVADEPMRNLYQFGFWSGLRLGEIFGLALDDLDFVKGLAHIRRSWTDGVLGIPKTPNSIRTIKLFPLALEALKRQRAFTELLPAVDCGNFGLLRFIFIDPRTQKPFRDDQTLRKGFWQPLLRKAKIRYRYPYQMRHTFASICLSSGEPEKWLANYLGHKNVNMLRVHYGKWLEEAAKNAGLEGGQRVAALFAAPQCKTGNA